VEDEDDNLKWITINVNGVSLYPLFLFVFYFLFFWFFIFVFTLILDRYGQFINKMIVDGVFRQVDFKLNSDNSITATIPNFWINAGLLNTQPSPFLSNSFSLLSPK
jgi:hypothetical protein